MMSAPGTAARCAASLAREWPLRARARYALSRGFGARRGIATAAAAILKSSNKGLQLPAAGPGTEAQAVEDHTLKRQANIKNARPFSDFLTDGFRRQHDYLRISITERCNLRCLYCMPEEGIDLSPSRNILTTPEIVLLANVFVSQGVNKIRLTGGEPTVRRDIVPLMQQLGDLRRIGLKELCLTTNGLALHRKLDTMAEAGLTGVNLSLDTLDPRQFRLMTRRDGFPAVRRSMDRIMAMNKAGAGIRLKINCVVMRGLNDNEINDFVALTQDHDLEVRFIEYMPFDGNRWSTGKMVSFNEMLERIGSKYPTLRRTVPDAHHNGPNDTSKTYEVPGFAGRVGFITSMTNSFCGGCNRLRITSDGSLKVCLFGNAEVSLRDVLRQANGGEPIDEASYAEIVRVAREAASVSADTSRDIPIDIPIDNLLPNASELLDIIGMAVKRKKERHAGIGELEHMKNRPMILIGKHIRPKLPHISSGSGLVRDWGRSPMGGLAGHFPPPGSAPWQARAYSTRGTNDSRDTADSQPKAAASTKLPEPLEEPRLTHVSASGTAHMVSVAEKAVTSRMAAAACTVRFSSPVAAALVRANDMAKGDVLGVARIAGIMAAKRTADLIPLCHPLALSHVAVDLEISDADVSSASTFTSTSRSISASTNGYISIRASVRCEGKTGVEMEALTAASVAALTVFDMCKAVDKGMRIDGLRVVYKDGGKSGRWEEK